MTRLTLALAAVGLALLAPTAQAQGQDGRNAPPGNSAIDEYVETVPGATGDRAPHGPSDEDTTPALSRSRRAALERQGEDGKQLAQLVAATAPATAPAGAHGSKAPSHPTGDTPETTTPTDEGEGGTGAVLATTASRNTESPLRATLVAAVAPNDAGGLGFFFPVILLASLVGTIALAVRRRMSA